MTFPNAQQWAWTAGLFEGEGCILLPPRDPRSVALSVGTTDEDVARRLHEWTGVGSVNGPYDQPRGTKPCWHWRVGAKAEVWFVLEGIMPYLCERRAARARDAFARLLIPQRPVAACGTRRGYKAHYRRGESACEQCRVANSAFAKSRKADARGEQGLGVG